MKVEFTKDYSTRNKGEKVNYDDRFAGFLIDKGVAKKHEKIKRVTKEEKRTRDTK